MHWEGNCEAWLEACKGDFFSPALAGVKKAPLPCVDSALVCSRLGDVFESGRELCQSMAVRVSVVEAEGLPLVPDAKRRGVPLPATNYRTRNTLPEILHGVLIDFDKMMASTKFGRLLNDYFAYLDRAYNTYRALFKIGILVWIALGTLFCMYKYGAFSDDRFPGGARRIGR